ncbi:tRNA (guanosine(46)-N7)-methyltransferase TrmB [Xanthovirga aplysinae]|uniref:tRNA (guanosine(46)-N7)-methyltransferase TrmB n=1 Tax=Xanthovirga aplysinae TaxID=2529853 RepID=UPI0016575525|nr:tRNA (guanosine(46)-N7)-methyltransferase TrmB [Xanthovirga aplysinae]
MRQKLQRFQENAQRKNTLEPGKDIYEEIKGNWNSVQFKNDNEIVLELGCGRGEYTVGLAPLHKDKNFIGVDIKGDRIWVGAGQAIEQNLDNVAFLRTQIQFLDKFFEPEEVSEIWITFPDPRPKDRDEKLRLTHHRYLDLYKKVLKPGGIINFKTDNTPLFEYTLEVLNSRKDADLLDYTFNLYEESKLLDIQKGIKTNFERKFHSKGEDIKFMRFSLN